MEMKNLNRKKKKGMAPRRKKVGKMVGNTRMDATLDAMRQLGFEEKLVRKTSEELFDVYE
jgi:hypothetical protein